MRRRQRYRHPIDNSTMFVALVFNEYTGEVNEFHAPHVSSAYALGFLELPSEVCHAGFMLNYPVAFMSANYVKSVTFQGGDYNDAGLRTPLPWKSSWPTSDASKFVRFFESNVGDFVTLKNHSCGNVVGCPGGHFVEMTARLSMTLTSSGDDAAGWADINMEMIDFPIAVRFVTTPHAGANGEKWLSTDFDEYVQSVHALYMRTQRGWDRWIDNHIALEIEPQNGMGYLDHVAKRLQANGVRWHAHLDTGGSNEGSIWTEGVGGLAFELHGRFDYSFFTTGGHDTTALHPMSMCQRDSEMPLMAVHNKSVWGQPLDEHLSDDEIANLTTYVATTPGALAERSEVAPLEEGLGEALVSMRAAAAAARAE
jgi:hypothetical protein